jgi:predicted GIY-YIG superfamily endonuclease
MHFGYIYKIVFPNGKHYIGVTTTSLEQRTKEHKWCAKRGDTKCLYNALRKYDMIDTLELIEIDTANTKEELCEKEIGYILIYNSYYMNGNGYNMTYGGEGLNGYVFTEEDNQKNSERMKKYYEENPEAMQKSREALKKYYEENPEAGKEHGEKMKKYWENPEARKEHGEKMKTHFENPEAIQKIGKH